MKLAQLIFDVGALACARHPDGARPRGGSGRPPEAAARIPGRLTTAITPASATARSTRSTSHRQEPDAGVDDPRDVRSWQPGGGGGRGGRGGGGGASEVIVGGEGTGDFPPAAAAIKASVLEVDGITVSHHAGQCLGRGCARRARALALLLEDQGRHAHRQSRPRACGITTCTWKRRTITWSRSMPRPAKSAGTKKSPICRRAISPRRRRWWSATTCWWARATTSTRPASCSPSIRKPASCNGSTTPCR